MPDVMHVSQDTKITGTLVGASDVQEVWLWDCGPEQPMLPEPPDPPTGRRGDPTFDLAALKYKRALKNYEEELFLYDKRAIEYKAFANYPGGPVELKFYSCDARDALEHDARAVKEHRQSKRRWCVSSRTRGSEKLPNFGLPSGMTPGPGHQENLEKQLVADKMFLAAMRADPVFGQEVRQ